MFLGSSREQRNGFYGHYMGMIFPYSLLTPSKFRVWKNIRGKRGDVAFSFSR